MINTVDGTEDFSSEMDYLRQRGWKIKHGRCHHPSGVSFKNPTDAFSWQLALDREAGLRICQIRLELKIEQ